MKDMRHFLERMEKERPEEFIRVKKEIDPRYEIATLVKKLEKEEKYPILFLEKVKGSKFPMVCNLYGSRERLAFALDTTSQKLQEEYREREAHPLKTEMVDSAPVQEVVKTGEEVNLLELPILTAHQADIAPYITSSIVIVTDPDTGIRNASFGRLMLVDRNTLYTHVTPGRHLHQIYSKLEKEDKPLQTCICIGTHPAWALGSLSLVPIDQDELEVMGAMAREPLKVVPGKTVKEVALAEAEIVLEGEILPKVRGEEGPFCEFTGYATGRRKREVIKVKAITHRKGATYHGLIAASTEHRLIGAISKESFLFKAAKVAVPSVKAIHVPVSGCGRFHVYVSMAKLAKGQPKNVAMAILGADIYAKHVIVVDEDIDVFDEKEVLWAVATRVQADRDIILIPRARGSDLDPSAEEDGVVCKAIIDATAKPFLKDYHLRATVPSEVVEKIKIEDYLPKGLI